MRYSQFVLMLSILVFVGCSQKQKPNTSISENNLNGPVKSIIELNYDAQDRFGELVLIREHRGFFLDDGGRYEYFNKSGNIYESGSIDSDGNKGLYWTDKYDGLGNKIESKFDIVNTLTLYKYDEKYNIIEECEYDSSGSISFKRLFNRNEKDAVVSETRSDKNGRLIFKDIFKYNDLDSLSEISYYDSLGFLTQKINYTYSDSGKIIRTYNNESGSLILKSIIKFDIFGNVIEYLSVGSYGSIDTKEISRYDENNNEIESVRYNKENLMDRKISSRYDEFNNLLEYNLQYFDGNTSEKTSYLYEYDKYNNWTKRTRFINDIPKLITLREIAYY